MLTEKIHSFLESNITAIFITFILAALAASGKLDVSLSNVFLVLAFFIGCFGIFRSGIRIIPRIAFFLCLLICLSAIALWINPRLFTSSQTTAVLTKKEPNKENQKTLNPPSILIKKIKDKKEDWPYFVLNVPAEIKIKPKFLLEIHLINKGKHTAINLHSRQIIIDQQFQYKPSIIDGSDVNEIPSELSHNYQDKLQIISSASEIAPFYVIYAIKYQDKESLFKMRPQIWYFKTMETWAGVDKGTDPPHLSYPTVQEGDNIKSHLKQELKDYL